MSAHFVAVKLESGPNAKRMAQLGLRWLPATAILDAEERLQHGWVGYLPPVDFAIELAFGRAMATYSGRDLDGARAQWTELEARHPTSERAPESLYWAGVAAYRQAKGDLAAAVAVWRGISERHPSSLWARKTEIFLEGEPA